MDYSESSIDTLLARVQDVDEVNQEDALDPKDASLTMKPVHIGSWNR